MQYFVQCTWWSAVLKKIGRKFKKKLEILCQCSIDPNLLWPFTTARTERILYKNTLLQKNNYTVFNLAIYADLNLKILVELSDSRGSVSLKQAERNIL